MSPIGRKVCGQKQGNEANPGCEMITELDHKKAAQPAKSTAEKKFQSHLALQQHPKTLSRQ